MSFLIISQYTLSQSHWTNCLCYDLAFSEIWTSGIRTSSPLYWWTQQDRSRIPSIPIWSSRVYKFAPAVRSTFQWERLHCLFNRFRLPKGHRLYQKNPDLHGRELFSTLSLEPCCARPRIKNLTLARCAHSASRTQRTEKPYRRLRSPRTTSSR